MSAQSIPPPHLARADARLGTKRNLDLDDLGQDYEQLGHLMTLQKDLEQIAQHSTDPQARAIANSLLAGVISRMTEIERQDLDRHMARRAITEIEGREHRAARKEWRPGHRA